MPAAHTPLRRKQSNHSPNTSDVLAEVRVNILEERTDNVLWFKERVMTQDEIVESVVQAPCGGGGLSTVLNVAGIFESDPHPSHKVHSFNLIPPAPKAAPALVAVGTIQTIRTPEHLDGKLVFSVRTSWPTPEKASPGKVCMNINSHSYPPAQPVAPSPSSSQTLSVPSPHEIKAKVHTITPQNTTTVTCFVFYPFLCLPTSIYLVSSPAQFLFSRVSLR
ncbi:hypothetical protein JB92DRAFT_3119882 [Gautieria morchelliformis]|nr:hypothetical protein JB92DRAFT_3119882 [Gautieria morchelliformis]